MLKVTTKIMLGGGGSSKTPLEWKFLSGGGCKPKTFHGRGMDIFWKHSRRHYGTCGLDLLVPGTVFAKKVF